MNKVDWMTKSDAILPSRSHVHGFKCPFFNHSLNIFVCSWNIRLVFWLNVKIQFPASNWGLFARLYFYTSERYCAVVLALNLMKEVLTACSLSGSWRIVVDFKVVREEIDALSIPLVLELVYQFSDLLYTIINCRDNFVLDHRLSHCCHRYIEEFLGCYCWAIFHGLTHRFCCLV